MSAPRDQGASRSRWWRRAPAGPVATSKQCPECKAVGPVRLYPGQVCAACEARAAWSRYGDGDRLVIDRVAIDEAIQRRAGEAAGEPVWRRALVWLAPAATLALAAITLACLWRLLAARSIGPLGSLLSEMTGTARWATLVGGAALVAGVVAVARMRRRRHFRRIGILVSHLIAIMAGCTAVLIGALHWYGLSGGFGGAYTSMPARRSLGEPSQVERIINATVVVLAPGADGDARALAMGTGAVVAADEHRAWIVTCSHVAMPYAAVGAYRHARDAQPVWVQLSDGREGRAMVRWAAPPPLDVVLVELPIEHPPDPVVIAGDTSAVQAAASVTFVPNPYRAGWKVLRGELLRRETHRTPAGTYDLLYTDLPVTHGDSGSGLFDARGQLIGLNTWTLMGGAGSQGISLPSETMRVLVEAIRAGRLDRLDDVVAPMAEAVAAPVPSR